MKFLPHDSYEIQTSLTLDTVVDLLKQKVEPRKWLRFSRSHQPFEGEVSGNGFTIHRIIHHVNSFLPIIQGTFEQNDNGIKILVRMRLHRFVSAFMCVWFGGLTIGILGLATAKTEPSAVLLIPLGMLLFGWGLASGCFWSEAKKAKLMLSDILQNSMTSEQVHAANRP
jgi:hypothetical protein